MATDSARHSHGSSPSRLALAVAGAAFLASGAAALVYQVAWQRILALASGVGIYSITVIVAAFMAGLGLGSHVGGQISSRVTPRRALGAFALLELGIASFGALSPSILYDLLYIRGARLYDSPWSASALHFASLLLPTTLMGMSLPFLVRALVRDVTAATRTTSLMYGLNVVGASLGAILTPWVLMREFGIRGALLVAAGLNLVAAVTAMGLVSATRTEADASAPPLASAAAEVPAHAGSMSLWMLLYGTSGLCALGMEILWFRIVDVAVRSTSFTFGTVLSLYLLCSGIGSLVGASVAPRIKDPLRSFLSAQCLLLVLAGVGVGLLAWVPVDAPFFSWYIRYWAGDIPIAFLGSSEDVGGLVKLYLLLPLTLFGLPTFLMGLSFPLLQRAVHDDPNDSSRRVGMLQAANIAGCIVGSLVVGLLALDLFGTPGSTRALLLLGLATFGALGLTRYGWRSRFLPLTAALAVVAALLPTSQRFWLRMHGRDLDPRPSLVAEDATGVGTIISDDSQLYVMINGRYHSWLPYGGVHTRIGAIPALVHPNPRDVAVIGLASGNTPWASGLREETRSITVFEIFRPQWGLLHLVDARPWPPLLPFQPLRVLLSDPRIRLVVADGRKALASGKERYDLILADALWPEAAFAGNLFSIEFFEMLGKRLKPGGIACSWAPTPRIRRTFRQAMPHVICVAQGVCLGSNEPLPLDLPLWRQRLYSPEVVRYLGGDEAAKDVWDSLSVATAPKGRPRAEFNRDLDPRDELLVRDRRDEK